MLQLLQVQILAHGNAATATKASSCTGNSATASKLATARNIKLQGAVNGNANFDGSGNITITTKQTNIAIITGSVDITMTQGGEQVYKGQKFINYPTGYNKDNCVVISAETQWATGKFFGYGSITHYPGSMLSGIIEKGVTLRDTDILLNARYDGLNVGGEANITETRTQNFKIVLLKIS